MMKLSEPRMKILRGLANVEGGWLPAEWLTVPARRLATRMQRDNLVVWRSFFKGYQGARLFITDAGRAALHIQERGNET